MKVQSNTLAFEVNERAPFANTDTFSERRSDAALSNRLEALRVLVLSLLNEIDALRELSETEKAVELDLRNEVHRFEAETIRYALIRTGGRQRRAARLLNMKVATLNAKIKRYHIDTDELVNGVSNLRVVNKTNLA